MKQRDDTIYLQHVLDAIAKIEEYLAGYDEDDFQKTSLVQDGVIRQLMIIGEAIKQLSDNFRQQHPQVPWKDIAGMRDKLVHDYLGVDLDEVWLTTQDDLPELKLDVTNMLDE
jgi:uncharacterized protein with HEPN domain